MLELEISRLVTYAQVKGWIQESDRIWAANRILDALRLHDYNGLQELTEADLPPIQAILDDLCAYAYENGVIEGNSTDWYDLFDTELTGRLMPRPSSPRYVL